MIKLSINSINLNKYENKSNKEYKEIFKQLKLKSSNETLVDFIELCASIIKQEYEYEISKKDIEYLNCYLNSISIDISNNGAFWSFLIYTIIKYAQNVQFHCIFQNNVLAKKYFEKAQKLYTIFDIQTSFHANCDENNFIKETIFNSNIIYANWKTLIFEQIYNLNKKASEKINIKFEQAFIFDIDRIIYDYEKCSAKILLNGLNPDEINIKEYFKTYTSIVGVSSTLFFENKKIEKNYQIKTKLISDSKKIMQKLKNADEKFFTHRDEKIRFLSKQIEELSKNNETIIIDVDNNEDFEILKGYLDIKKIKYQNLKLNQTNKDDIYTILTPGKITIMSNLLSANIEAKLGGNFEQIARNNALKMNDDISSNFYKEKFKKELQIQKEITQKNTQEILKKGGINIFFASHYTELKYEYCIVDNYKHSPIKQICFYNCSEDEAYKDFKLDNLNVFNNKSNSENEILFKILSKFVFYIKKYSINKFLTQEIGCITHTPRFIPIQQQNQMQTNKVGRNEPCPCGSGKKFKNCCGKN